LTDAATVTYLNSKYATLQASNNFAADVLINQVTHQLTMTNKIRFGANVRDVAGFTSLQIIHFSRHLNTLRISLMELQVQQQELLIQEVRDFVSSW
jgi:hypothetical protein